MKEAKPASTKGRRDKTHSVVANSLNQLMDETNREDVPSQLVELAQQLQAAIDAKA